MNNESNSYESIPGIWDIVEKSEEIAQELWGYLFLVESFKWTDGDYFVKTYQTGPDKQKMLTCGGDEGWWWYITDSNQEPPDEQTSLIRSKVVDCRQISDDPNSIDRERAIDVYREITEDS